VIVAGDTCQFRRGLLRCGRVPAGRCQYCGRIFCERHGVHYEDEQEICTRGVCIAKRDDLARHLVYKSSVLQRNAGRICGVESCESEHSVQCLRCRGYFCRDHAYFQEETVFDNGTRMRRRAILCRHCHARRPIWLRQ
jgi:hypothetical protein